MSKAARKRARRAQGAARRDPDSRRRTRTLYAAVAVVAAAVAGALVLASVLTARDDDSAPSGAITVAGAAESRALFAGVPQQGIALGRPNAAVTLVEFADLQCPFCAEWSRNALPELVRDYVRPGRVRIVFRGLAFNGIRGTPSFAVGRTGGTLRVVELDSLDAQALRPYLDALLAG
jgi:protein-disulfide isomerase